MLGGGVSSQGDMMCGVLGVGGGPTRTEHQFVNHQRHAAATFLYYQPMPSLVGVLQRERISVQNSCFDNLINV